MKNYIRFLFLSLLTASIGIFFFAAYSLFAGRIMEKEYMIIRYDIDSKSNDYATKLASLNITDYEKRALATKYKFDIYINKAQICYSDEGDIIKEAELNDQIRTYNAECKKKGVPETLLRTEIEDIYSTWVKAIEPLDKKRKGINSRIYADGSANGKLDLNIINILAIAASIGTLVSMIGLLLVHWFLESHKKNSI